MKENSLEKLISENDNIFRRVNYLLLDGVNISASKMPAEYSFIEESFEILSGYYEILGYKIQNYDNNYYLSVYHKDRYTPFEYYSKSETFLGMYLSLKFFRNIDDPIFDTIQLFEELNSIFELEHLYEIFVKRMQNFNESDKRLETVKENYVKTLKQLNKYNFIEVVDATNANIGDSRIEVKSSIKRFLDLALELYDKQNREDLDLGELLEVFIKETEFEIAEEE